MASIVQAKVKKVKPSARNAVEKYKEILDQTLKELTEPQDLREGLQAFITAGEEVQFT